MHHSDTILAGQVFSQEITPAQEHVVLPTAQGIKTEQFECALETRCTVLSSCRSHSHRTSAPPGGQYRSGRIVGKYSVWARTQRMEPVDSLFKLLLSLSAAGSYRLSLSAFCHSGHHSTHEITAYLRLRLRIPQHSKKGDECQSHRAVQARELSASTVFNAFLCNLHWMNGCKENEQAAAGPAVFPRLDLGCGTRWLRSPRLSDTAGSHSLSSQWPASDSLKYHFIPL